MYEPSESDYYFQLVFCAKNVAYEVICDYMQYAIFGSNPILSRVYLYCTHKIFKLMMSLYRIIV